MFQIPESSGRGVGKAIASFSQDIHVLVRGKLAALLPPWARSHLIPAQTLPAPLPLSR